MTNLNGLTINVHIRYHLNIVSLLNKSVRQDSFVSSRATVKCFSFLNVTIYADAKSNLKQIIYRSFSEPSSKCDSASPWENRKRDHIPLQAGQLNPVSDPDSQRYVYVENNKGSPRLWKKVEDQELGGNVGLYVVFFKYMTSIHNKWISR